MSLPRERLRSTINLRFLDPSFLVFTKIAIREVVPVLSFRSTPLFFCRAANFAFTTLSTSISASSLCSWSEV